MSNIISSIGERRYLSQFNKRQSLRSVRYLEKALNTVNLLPEESSGKRRIKTLILAALQTLKDGMNDE